jgi:hypothetical protein
MAFSCTIPVALIVGFYIGYLQSRKEEFVRLFEKETKVQVVQNNKSENTHTVRESNPVPHEQ